MVGVIGRTMSLDRWRRERARALIVAGFELILGVLFILLGWQLFNVSNVFHTMLGEMVQSPYTPTYVYELYRTIQVGFLIGGFIAFVHGAKRMVDNMLDVWAKSALPKEETS